MSVIAESNKYMLWDVLKGLVSENELQVRDVAGFKEFFENKCKFYHSKRFDYDGLSEVNKKIIGECFNFLKSASNNNKLLMFRDYEQFGNKKVVKTMSIGKRYKQHEKNFKKMINKAMPDDIDFSEEGDAPIRDMGNMLSKTMEQRESELNNITQRYDQGDSLKWLNSGGVPKLTIHDDNFEYLDNTANNVEMVVNEKKQQPIKKVKFKSNLKAEITKETKSNNVTEINTNAMREQQMNEYFNKKNKEMNGNKTKEGEMYLSKRDIIDEIKKREKEEKENENSKESVSLTSVFSSMKVKSKDSDIIAAKQQTDTIDINQRVDRLEQYLSDIIVNQLKIMEMLSQKNINVDSWKEKTDDIAKEIEYVIEESKPNDGIGDKVEDKVENETIAEPI
tara:strand:+ start:1348 stop:2526 length:1179 start_codon:yes stop_codon:yes gene_type:complete